MSIYLVFGICQKEECKVERLTFSALQKNMISLSVASSLSHPGHSMVPRRDETECQCHQFTVSSDYQILRSAKIGKLLLTTSALTPWLHEETDRQHLKRQIVFSEFIVKLISFILIVSYDHKILDLTFTQRQEL